MTLSAEQLERITTVGTGVKSEVPGLIAEMPSQAPLLGEDAPLMAFELDGEMAQYFINRAGRRWARELHSEALWVELS